MAYIYTRYYRKKEKKKEACVLASQIHAYAIQFIFLSFSLIFLVDTSGSNLLTCSGVPQAERHRIQLLFPSRQIKLQDEHMDRKICTVYAARYFKRLLSLCLNLVLNKNVPLKIKIVNKNAFKLHLDQNALWSLIRGPEMCPAAPTACVAAVKDVPKEYF